MCARHVEGPGFSSHEQYERMKAQDLRYPASSMLGCQMRQIFYIKVKTQVGETRGPDTQDEVFWMHGSKDFGFLESSEVLRLVGVASASLVKVYPHLSEIY